MAVGEQVSNGALRNTRRPPRGMTALPGMGALLGGTNNSPTTRGTFMEHIENNEQKESLAVWASEKNSCTEAPEGATGQDSVMSFTGGTPLIKGENLSDSQIAVQGPTEKFSSLGLQKLKKNRCGSARKRSRKTRRLEATTGATAGVNPRPLLASCRNCKGRVHLGTKGRGHLQRSRNLWRARCPLMHISDNGRPAVLRGAGRLRGPNRLGNLGMPGPPRRASGC
jgi:hypothetical protein